MEQNTKFFKLFFILLVCNILVASVVFSIVPNQIPNKLSNGGIYSDYHSRTSIFITIIIQIVVLIVWFLCIGLFPFLWKRFPNGYKNFALAWNNFFAKLVDKKMILDEPNIYPFFKKMSGVVALVFSLYLIGFNLNTLVFSLQNPALFQIYYIACILFIIITIIPFLRFFFRKLS